MPLHFYLCALCDLRREEYRSVQEGGTNVLPFCPVCGEVMAWEVPVVAMDAKEPGQRRSVITREIMTRQGPRQITEEVNTLHRLRQIERDSEQRYRNGEGEPLRFRAYAQDRSNLDENSFGHAGVIGERAYSDGQAPTKRSNIGVRRHGEDRPEAPSGPGVSSAGASPLRGSS